MPYTLDNFTKQASPALMAQAQALVSAGAVSGLEQMDIEWLAEVQDNAKRFDVAIAVGPHGELLSTCGCGDETNDLCRHAVAVLLAGAGDKARRPPPAKARAKPAKAPRKNTVDARLRALLEAAPPAAIIDLLVSLAKADKHLQSRIQIELGNIGDSLETFTAAVQGALSPRGGQSAWSDAHKAKAAATQLDLLLQRAVMKGASGEADVAVRMALTIYEQVQETLEKTHSCRPIEASAEQAMVFIQQELPRISVKMRDTLLQSLVHSVKQARYIDTPRVIATKRTLADLVTTPAERTLVEPLLDPPRYRYYGNARDEIWSVNINNDYVLRYGLIARLDGAQAALAFVKENSRFVAMRAILYEDALARNDLNGAYELAEEGLRLSDKANLDKVADAYVVQMIAIAEKRGETPSDLYMRQFHRCPDSEHWLRYKQSIPANAWKKERARALGKGTIPLRTLYTIYNAEAMWKQLMDLVKREFAYSTSAISVLADYGPALAAATPTELAAWCAKAVDNSLQRYGANLQSCHEIATILKRMSDLGLGAQSAAIVARLRRENPKRKDLLQALEGL